MRIILLILLLSVCYGTTINVPADYSTIQGAIDASSTGDTVLVSAGTYYENIVWAATNGIKLIGSGEDDCIIDGNSLASVIRFEEDLGGIIDSTTLITGFTVLNGHAQGYHPYDDGGGIRLSYSSPTLTSVTLSNNTAAHAGGGMYLRESSPTLTDVTFSGNLATIGGGMSLDLIWLEGFDGSNPTLTDVTFSDNTAWSGGGMYLSYSSPTLTDVTFSGNSADIYGGGGGGGGMSLDYSNATLTNVTFSGNTAEDYGGTGPAGKGGGMYLSNFSSAVMTNCIFWGNGDDAMIKNHNSTVAITYSDIKGGWNGTGNIDADPFFCDAENGDFTLAEHSLCVGTGQNGANMGALGVGCGYDDYCSGCSVISEFCCDNPETIDLCDGQDFFCDCSNGTDKCYEILEESPDEEDCEGLASGGEWMIKEYATEQSCESDIHGFSLQIAGLGVDDSTGIFGPGCETIISWVGCDGSYLGTDDTSYLIADICPASCGFIITGCDTLIVLGLDGMTTGLSDINITKANDVEIPFTYIETPDEICTLAGNNIHITSSGTILYNTDTPILGFQFNVDGANVVSASGGVSEDAGFQIFVSNYEAGEEVTYTDVIGCDYASCDIYGCTSSAACNYNSDATVDDGNCEFVMDGGDGDECLDIDELIIPENYSISSIYPNPFNPATTISFSIPEFGLTTITAYDINGRKLETLTNEVLSIGNYSINWNASSYPSGVYLIRMESGDFTQTQKVVLVK